VLIRIWADNTWQEAFEEPYSHMSDDYILMEVDEDYDIATIDYDEIVARRQAYMEFVDRKQLVLELGYK